jgi:hypothetical protein
MRARIRNGAGKSAVLAAMLAAQPVLGPALIAVCVVMVIAAGVI